MSNTNTINIPTKNINQMQVTRELPRTMRAKSGLPHRESRITLNKHMMHTKFLAKLQRMPNHLHLCPIRPLMSHWFGKKTLNLPTMITQYTPYPTLPRSPLHWVVHVKCKHPLCRAPPSNTSLTHHLASQTNEFKILHRIISIICISSLTALIHQNNPSNVQVPHAINWARMCEQCDHV